MNKKIILISLISLSVFIAGCSNKKSTQPITNNINSQGSTKKLIQQSTTTTNTADTTKNSTTNEVNSNSNSNTAVINNSENNPTTVQNEEAFYGQWVIKKVVGFSRVGTYSGDDINKMVGKKLSFSKEQSSCFGDDASYLNDTVKNPTYKKSIITSDEFLNGWRVPISTLTINSNTVTQIEIDDAKKNRACTFYIKDDNTLILYGGGTFFELSRVTQTQIK